ncbi:hypothetical protein FRC12_006314 [Ceratobasidium sp. 428]|nr:hypothetical protein FRC12_006314 [Ceratobasidium sp. 428]
MSLPDSNCTFAALSELFSSSLLQPSILPLLPDITSPISVTKTVRYVFNRGPEVHTNTGDASSFHAISNNESATVIGVGTKPAKIVDCLVQHGCRDATEELDLLNCRKYPIARGGFGNVYRGQLKSGQAVAIKCLTMFDTSNDDCQQQRYLKVSTPKVADMVCSYGNLAYSTGTPHLVEASSSLRVEAARISGVPRPDRYGVTLDRR